jgi:hypothetical protein
MLERHSPSAPSQAQSAAWPSSVLATYFLRSYPQLPDQPCWHKLSSRLRSASASTSDGPSEPAALLGTPRSHARYIQRPLLPFWPTKTSPSQLGPLTYAYAWLVKCDIRVLNATS